MTRYSSYFTAILALWMASASLPAIGAPRPYAAISTSAPGGVTFFQYDVVDSLFFDDSAMRQVIYRDLDSSEWHAAQMSLLYAVCTTWTYSGSITFVPASSTLEFYFRSEVDSAVVTQSPKNTANQFPPPAYLTTDLGDDQVGDAQNAAGTWLDITGLKMTYSDTRLFADLSNAGGGFPSGSALSFYLYSVGIVNPDATDSAAYAMIYGNVPFIFSPGLYRINPADSSFTKIGNLSTSIQGNTLHLACDLSDLVAQPGWATWPPASGYILSAPLTATQTLSGLTVNDVGKGAVFLPESQTIVFGSNTPPTLTNQQLMPQPGRVDVSVDYTDADGNLAVLREFNLIGIASFEMTACEKDYAAGAVFTTTAYPDTTGWYQYFFRFSDGADTVTTLTQSIFLEAHLSGDANGDGLVSVSDAVYLINYIFAGGPAPQPLAAGDANCDGLVTVSDAVYLIEYLFAGGPAPC